MSEAEDRRLLITVFYEGPWERLCNLALAIRRDNTLRREIPEDHWRNRIADWLDYRDKMWVNSYALRKRTPNARWKRRGQAQ